MENPGPFSLGDLSLTTSVTGSVITSAQDAQQATQAYVSGLDGMFGATLQANFTYGSGGTSCTVTVETTLDQGVDMARGRALRLHHDQRRESCEPLRPDRNHGGLHAGCAIERHRQGRHLRRPLAREGDECRHVCRE
jgi:hypothetical protein